MFTKKEVTWLIVAVVIAAFVMGLTEKLIYELADFLMYLIIAALIILTTVITKKIAAEHFDIEIEHKIWEFKRYGFYERAYLKKPVPLGLIIPFFIAFLTLGAVKPLTLLQFDYKNLPRKRILRRRGGKQGIRKREINETDHAFTAAWGFYSLLVLAAIGIIINIPALTKFSIYYGLWNLIPISGLDGLKIFFGSLLNWALLVILYLIGFAFVLTL